MLGFRKKPSEIAELKELITHQNKQMGVLLESIASYHMNTYEKDYPYRTRESMVNECIRKYSGTANKGNMIFQRLVNLRVAFSVPNRLFLIGDDTTDYPESAIENAKDYLNAFMAFNNLDSSLPRDLSKEAELEGQVAVRLVWDNEAKLPRLRYYPQSSTGYVVKPSKDKYSVKPPLKLDFTYNQDTVSLTDDKFSYISFNDKLGIWIGYPTCGPILREIEHLEKDMLDWRKLNHLFAHPTPHFKCETQEEADTINEMITGLGWKVGTAIATSSDFSLKGPTGAEANLLMLSITTHAKLISAHTGIGIHFLGFANVMSNRATAESMGEPTEVVLHAEISGWKAFYKDLFQKAITMRNARLNRQLPVDAVIPKIIPITDRQWKTIKDIFMPAAEKKLISHEFFLSQLPDVDTEAEMERIKDEEKEKPKEKVPANDIGDGNNEEGDEEGE